MNTEMSRKRPTTSVAIQPDTARDFNKLKDEVNQKVPYRITADLLLKMLIEAFTKNGV